MFFWAFGYGLVFGLTQNGWIGLSLKHSGRHCIVGCVGFSTKSKNQHTPPEWGCEGMPSPHNP